MSHHSDEALLVAGSDSFWEPGNYKRTTKRVEDGNRLCVDLCQLIHERSEIEKAYAKGLRNWGKKWNDLIEKGPEYGTTEAAWKGVTVESERICEMHLRVRDRLMNDVVPQIKQWQRDNFHKTMIHMQFKERREMDDAFKKVQKPWAKLLAKVNKCKQDYHIACKNERSAQNLERNAGADTSLSPDQVKIKKMQERVAKAKEDVQKSRERYESALKELNDYNPKYIEEMKDVFHKCQDFEHSRLEFFKQMLFGMHACLNISTDPMLPQIYEEYRHTIQNADATKDLKWWSANHGVGMAMSWPQFEEYSEEFRDIVGTSKLKKGATLPEGGILLVNQQRINDDVPDYNPDARKEKRNETMVTSSVIQNNRLNDKNTKNSTNNRTSTVATNGAGGAAASATSGATTNKAADSSNPFDDEEWDEDDEELSGATGHAASALTDDGSPGVAVRALYDYEGAEEDELSFKQGETFEKLEDEDEQGWCKGRKDGRVGLYPANYVEVVAST